MAGYEPVGWKNYPDKTTSISAENLNHMDEGIKKLDTEKLNIDKITQSTAVNQDGYALDAREKNASISGTMANQISELNTNLKNAVIVKTYTKRLELAANEYFATKVTAPSVEGYKCIASCYCAQVNGNNTKSYIYFSDYSEKNNNFAIENLLSQKNVSEHKIVFIYTEQ